MHILILAQYFPPDMGGSSTRAYNVARGIVLNGVEATVVTAFPHYPSGEIPRCYWGRPFKVEETDGFKVIRTFMVPLESKGLFYRLITFITFILSSLMGLVFVRNVDAVWVANPDIFGLIPGIIYRTLHRCPLLFNVDDLSIEDVSNLHLIKESSIGYRLAKAMTRFLYRRADAVTPISPGYFEAIQGLGVEKTKIRLVWSGVDLDTFKHKLYTHSEHFTVAYSGSFSVAYDFDQIIEAAKQLKNQKDIVFVIQGKGELADSIGSRVDAEKLRNVEVIEKILTRPQVSDLLSEAQALILPLRDFGTPYLGVSSKLYEYQALGRPIICCAKGQPAKYIEETSSGLVVDPGDSKKLAETIMFLYRNPEEAARLGESGRRYVEDNVSLEQVGAQILDIVKGVLDHRATSENRGVSSKNRAEEKR